MGTAAAAKADELGWAVKATGPETKCDRRVRATVEAMEANVNTRLNVDRSRRRATRPGAAARDKPQREAKGRAERSLHTNEYKAMHSTGGMNAHACAYDTC